MIAIRDFERFTGGKPFERITAADVAIWRTEVIRRAGAYREDRGISRSSARHRASHLRRFFEWLAKQPAHKHLDGISGYFQLPRKFHAGPELSAAKVYPTIDEALEMLNSLPRRTLKDRRDRAIFAMAFVAGLRESALITLRVRHVDVVLKRVHHDGRDLNAKNGKSFEIDWFPRSEPFQAVLLDWINEVHSFGISENDALFPDIRKIAGRDIARQGRSSIDPMRTAGAVDAVFAQARKGRQHYTPHSARHTLAALGDKICRTPEQRKAWSLNLGHSSEAVTWAHYGRVDDARKAAIFAEFGQIKSWTDEELLLMLSYHEHQLCLGTPEFNHAQRLVERYRTAGQDSAVDGKGLLD